MKIFMTIITLILVSACAEKNPDHKKNPLQGLPERTTFESKSALQKAITYESKNLRVTYPNPKNSAKIFVHGAHAQALFSKLKVESIDDTKKGHHVICSKKKDTTCELDIDYANGLALISIENDIPASDVTEIIKLKGQDAVILYMLMNVIEIDTKAENLKKIGQDYFCTKKSSEENEDEYLCKLNIDMSSGKVIAI